MHRLDVAIIVVLALLCHVQISVTDDSKEMSWPEDLEDVVNKVEKYSKTQLSNQDVFLAKTKEELKQVVDYCVEVFTLIKNNTKHIMDKADATAKQALNKIDGWMTEAVSYQQQVIADGKNVTDTQMNEWNAKVKKWYSEGMQDLGALMSLAPTAHLSALVIFTGCALAVRNMLSLS